MEQIVPSSTTTDHFLLCLGTSNTYGDCRDGDKLYITREETLPGLLTERLGIKCYNLGIGGVLMNQMTDALIDTLDTYDITMCKGVLVEAQQGLNSSSQVAYDNFVDWEDNYRVKNTLMSKTISAGRDKQGVKSTIAEDRFFFKQVGANMTDAYYIERLTKAFGCPPPLQALKKLKDYMRFRLDMYHRSDHAWWDDIKQVRVMRSICKHAGIPFRWYHWYPENKTYNKMQKWIIEEYDMFSDHLFDGNPIYDLFDSDNYRCECRHINAEGNIVIADLVTPKVREWIS